MDKYVKNVEIRWSDIDANMHLRHSVYYDWGAYVRMCFMAEHGITMERLHALQIGPVLLKEEAVFRREVKFGDHISIDICLVAATRQFSRISLQHVITKNNDTTAATVTVDFRWIDTQKRKLTIPPFELVTCFDLLPKHPSFQWLD